MRTCIFSSGCRNADLQLLLRMQKWRFITPSQDVGMQIYNSFSGCRNHSALHGGWDTHSSALGLQTQQYLEHLNAGASNTLVKWLL
jgi:hypothetical protein